MNQTQRNVFRLAAEMTESYPREYPHPLNAVSHAARVWRGYGLQGHTLYLECSGLFLTQLGLDHMDLSPEERIDELAIMSAGGV